MGETRNIQLFTIASKTSIKYKGTHLIKEAQDLHTENYESSSKEIKEALNQPKDSSCYRLMVSELQSGVTRKSRTDSDDGYTTCEHN